MGLTGEPSAPSAFRPVFETFSKFLEMLRRFLLWNGWKKIILPDQTPNQTKRKRRKNMRFQTTVQSTTTDSTSGRFFQHARRMALSAPGRSLLIAATLLSLLSLPPVTRADETNEDRKPTGTWMVTVTRVNPPPTFAPTFLSLMTYFNDGNFIEESNTSSIRSTHRGNWERIGHQQFTRSSISFRFDAARNYLGTSRLTATVTLSEDGNQFQGTGVLESFDGSGNLLTTAQSTEVGQRL
jgi:hypothetical protein